MSPFLPFNEPMPETAVAPEAAVIARFTIPGNPRPKERPRFGKGRTFTPKATALEETRVQDAFYDAYPFWVAVDHKLELSCTFYRDSRRVVDLDNLAKLIQDALNKHAFLDDSQVFDLHAHKFFTTKKLARTEVVLARVYGDRIEMTG